MRRTCRSSLAACLVVVAAASAHAAVERESRRFGPPFKPLDVRVTVGEVEIRASDRADIVVEVEREAPDAAGLARIPLDVADTEDVLIINASQRDGGNAADLRTKVVLLVPLVTVFRQVSVFEGRIEVDGLRGAIQARIDRGPIKARGVAGVVRFETVAGDVTVERALLRSDGLLRVRTFNGNVRMGLAEAPRDARVLLLTLKGTIASDIALQEREGFGPRFREGTFGTAQPLLSIDAVRGDLVLTLEK